ncbi:MAG: Abi family protein [Saprospiraceae bacterium]
MRYRKPPLPVSDQITLLENRGLLIPDHAKAAHYLSNISYYRLRAYTYPFQNNQDPNHPFRPGTTFDQILDVYLFDRALRILVFDAIERIEIALRTQIIHQFALIHGSHWHENPALYNRVDLFIKDMGNLNNEMQRSSEVFIKHYFRKYTSPPNPPAWMSLEVTSMGLLSKIYENLKINAEKKAVAAHFGLGHPSCWKAGCIVSAMSAISAPITAGFGTAFLHNHPKYPNTPGSPGCKPQPRHSQTVCPPFQHPLYPQYYQPRPPLESQFQKTAGRTPRYSNRRYGLPSYLAKRTPLAMKKYPTYKPSGVEWMGEVPEHWEVKKLKRLAKICNGQDHKNVWTEDGEYPIIGTGGEFGRANSFLSNGPSVILGRKGTIDKPQFIEHPFWSVDTAYFTEIYNFTDPKFFYYCCTTIQFDRYKYGSAVPSMTQETLNQIPFATPPLPEQTAIAAYLDRKTAQIDQTIAEKERLIELFREERQALINHAVTKGIRPGVKMKDSGVEWIGEVPEGWEVSKLKYYVRTKARLGWKGLKAEEYVESGFGFLSTPNIKGAEIDFEKINFITEERYEESPEIMLEEGDVLLAKDGSTLGIVNIVKTLPFPCTVNSSIAVLRVFEKTELHPAFLKYYIESDFTQNVIQNLKAGMGVPHLFQADINNFEILLPPIQEQVAIAAHIDQKTTQIDTAISGIQQEIALLQEYRQALIFEAVTGKIDVREYAQN